MAITPWLRAAQGALPAVMTVLERSAKTLNPELQVLKARPKIPLVMTRDSVCAGDDSDAPHEKKIEVHSFLAPEAFVNATAIGYLPSVAGVGHSWTFVLNGLKIAEIGTSSIRALVGETPFADENYVHFVYHSATF